MMLRLAGHTCAHDHNGKGAVRAHKPVQNGSGQEVRHKVYSFPEFPLLFDCFRKSNCPAFGQGPFAISFRSGRVTSSAARRGDFRVSSRAYNRAGSPQPINHIADRRGQAVAHLSRLPVWRASRCLSGKEFLQGQEHLIGVGRSALGHHMGLSFLGSSSAERKARKRRQGLGFLEQILGQKGQAGVAYA